MCIIEGDTGNFIIDTKGDVRRGGNITNLASVRYKDGFTYSKLAEDIRMGNSGYTSFVSKGTDEFLYVRYGSLGFEEWRIMLAQSESVVFSGTTATLKFLVTSSAIICIIILIYILGVMIFNKKISDINNSASEIRKKLLEINQRRESLTDALKRVTEFAGSRSAFVTDSYGEENHYILPSKISEGLNDKEVYYFNNKLLYYASKHRSVHGAEVYHSEIKLNNELLNEMPEFYNFIKGHNIVSVKYAVVINNNSNIYVLGVINPTNKNTTELILKIAVCFAMAIYNQKHLERTKIMALTDSLTDIENRMAFTQYIEHRQFEGKQYACIYVDVNELHYYNNKYGHAAGDQMLVFIANSLKAHFNDSRLYRMGGDEFLILCEGIEINDIEKRIASAQEEIEEMKYHIAVGIKYGAVKTTIEEMVNAAEKEMYDNKARYYQDKELKKIKGLSSDNTHMLETGVREIDACLSIMGLRYMGIYCVSLENDSCTRIIAPTYFKVMPDDSILFSSLIKRYIYEFVKSEFHRPLLNFLDYDILKQQLLSKNIPSAKYERIDGEKILLKIYPIAESDDAVDCIWIFEKEEI